MSFTLEGLMPKTQCANCTMTDDLNLVPYMSAENERIMIAVILLCGLCRDALTKKQLGIQVATGFADHTGEIHKSVR